MRTQTERPAGAWPEGDTEPGDRRAVAVIGMACRLPGAAGPEELWDLLSEGRDAVGAAPDGRPGLGDAGYVDGIADFDPGFFGMAPAEAAGLDPQQRLLLMTAWEALEDAGIPADTLAGTRTGVYVGGGRTDFYENTLRAGLDRVTAAELGNVRSLLAGRLSYWFDLRGPSVVVDTACSSSLVAVHDAVRSLRAGECPLALAAGANLVLRPDENVLMSRAGGLAGDGRTKFGDAAADGHAPGDAVAVVVLKPLADAVADGDRVRAVIAGSAIGNNGRTGGTVLNPSLAGQVEVLRAAYEDAGVDPADVDYVEAHGSGSPLLDPLELTALGTVLGAGRPADRPLPVGSVKTNIGHAEAASGLAGLIKTVLCLEHGRVPAGLNVHTPRPDVDWTGMPVTLADRPYDLSVRGRPAIAGVSGQGSSTLNAHVVLRAADPHPATSPATDAAPGAGMDVRAGSGDRPYVLALSARTPEALADLADAYITYLRGAGAAYDPRDICYSAAVRRTHLEHHRAVTGRTHEDLARALAGHPGPAHPVATLYEAGADVDWAEVFGTPGRYVPLPTYPWQLCSLWPGQPIEAPAGPSADGDLAFWILGRHAVGGAGDGDDTPLADIGIDSLAKLQLVAEVQNRTGREIDVEVLGRLRTVGDLCHWAAELTQAEVA